MAVVATLSKGYDLDYIWKQVDRGPAKDAAGYYIQASETGGEPPGRWWGPDAMALGFQGGQWVERQPCELLFGERRAPDDTVLGRPPASGRKAADLYVAVSGRWPNFEHYGLGKQQNVHADRRSSATAALRPCRCLSWR